jgi:hypothetical protein
VPLVSKPFSFACRAERLAGATAGPNGSIIRPSGAAQGVAPDPNACEEVALGIPGKFRGFDIFDAPFVNKAGGDLPSGN